VTTPARTLGVVGTMVFDRIIPFEGRAVEGWGGIGYSVAAASATLPPDWGVRPVARVGQDLFREAREALAAMPRCDLRLVRVAEPNNRVELRYRDPERRSEHLSGGVSGWQAPELLEALLGCDAVLLNFISGHELELQELQRLRRGLKVTLYADVHSLFLDTGQDGVRTPRVLEHWRSWFACFDVVQMNEEEFSLLTQAADGPGALEDVLEAGPTVACLTRGARGADVAFREDGRTFVEQVILPHPRTGDPTGCGDIWGSVMFGRLLAGARAAEAAEAANRVAAASLDHFGVEGLVERLADVPLGRAGEYLDSWREVDD